MKAIVIGAATALGVLVIATAGPASASPALFNNGFGNAQETINALAARGYNVALNGAVTNPLSGCKVTGVEGLDDSNITAGGTRIDTAGFDTVYVDIQCRGG
ncbi:hypothetical protein A5724_07890 [Mycobacterium sp. ACS1612]|nr:hypothetical protein A5724_07890 [Mycobacterium sp. ACS1612]